MPDVKPGEGRNEYVARCVRVAMGEGLDQKAAVGKCEGMYDGHVQKAREAVRKAVEARDSLVGATPAQRQLEYERVYKSGMDEARRVGKAAYEEGHVSHRAGGDFRKTGGQWVRMPQGGTTQSAQEPTAAGLGPKEMTREGYAKIHPDYKGLHEGQPHVLDNVGGATVMRPVKFTSPTTQQAMSGAQDAYAKAAGQEKPITQPAKPGWSKIVAVTGKQHEGAAYAVHDVLNNGMTLKQALDNQNLYGDRPDIVAEQERVKAALQQFGWRDPSGVQKSTVSPDPFTDDYSAEEKVKKLDRDPLRDALEKVEKVTKEDIKKTGEYEGKSNELGHGGRAAQLKAQGVPEGVIGEIARAKHAAPGQANYHAEKSADPLGAVLKSVSGNRVGG